MCSRILSSRMRPSAVSGPRVHKSSSFAGSQQVDVMALPWKFVLVFQTLYRIFRRFRIFALKRYSCSVTICCCSAHLEDSVMFFI